MTPPEPTTKEYLDQAIAIVEKAKENKGIVLRAMGAIAVRLHCPKLFSVLDDLNRVVTDLDFMGYSSQVSATLKLMKNLGFNFDYGLLTDRKIFTGNNGIHVDVFLDRLSMCHEIDFKNRLDVDYPTISLADIMLEKLQIVRINDKDIKDMAVMMAEHDIGAGDKEMIDSEYISGILANDWGFYFTATSNLNKVRNRLKEYSVLTREVKESAEKKIDGLLSDIESRPKSLRWKMRSRVGTKIKWYNEVEDVKQ